MNSVELNSQLAANPAESLRRRWRELLDAHLPVFEKGSMWRYSRLRNRGDAEQGWKLHVSATILTAAPVLELVAPFLKSCEAFYKTPSSLDDLKKLNAGIIYDYTQIENLSPFIRKAMNRRFFSPNSFTV